MLWLNDNSKTFTYAVYNDDDNGDDVLFNKLQYDIT